MNTLDIGICLIGAFFALRGLFRGFISEVTGIAGAVLGLYLANAYSPMAEPLLAYALKDPRFLPLAAFLLVFIVTMMVAGLVGVLLRRFVSLAMLTWADHVLGGVFGLAKAALLAGVALVVLTVLMPSSGLMTQSVLRPYVMPAADQVADFLPEGLRGTYERNKARLPRRSVGNGPAS